MVETGIKDREAAPHKVYSFCIRRADSSPPLILVILVILISGPSLLVRRREPRGSEFPLHRLVLRIPLDMEGGDRSY